MSPWLFLGWAVAVAVSVIVMVVAIAVVTVVVKNVTKQSRDGRKIRKTVGAN